MTKYAIVADLNRCVGCQTCTSACKHANATAPGIQWRKVLDFEVGEFPDVARAFVPVGCMHCDEPPCMEVCPTTATRKRDDGIVTIDYNICIGCAYCAVACPYQARYRVDKPAVAYDGKVMRHETLREDAARIGVAQKCTMCVDLIDEGIAGGMTPGIDATATPACVSSCISSALQMGDLDDPNSNVSLLLRENRHFRMHEELGTGPNIYYLYDRDTGDHMPVEPAPMVAKPVGLAAVSSKLQHNWDWRAAANFVLGGAGMGLFGVGILAGFASPVPSPVPNQVHWLVPLVALMMVATGLFCVWLEIGRPWRFLNTFLNARTSWMSREAMAAMPYFAFGGLYLLWPNAGVGLIAALSGLIFLYCQGRILRAAKGIPAWRANGIVPLIFVTGLTEGTGLFAMLSLFGGGGLSALAPFLFGLVALRALLWRRYRSNLGATGAPVATFTQLDAGYLNLSMPGQLVVLGMVAIGLFSPLVLALAGALALVTGWGFKFTLITRAAFNQGFAINRVPARGAGKSGAGIKPGWTLS